MGFRQFLHPCATEPVLRWQVGRTQPQHAALAPRQLGSLRCVQLCYSSTAPPWAAVDRQLTGFAQPQPHEYRHSGRVAGCHARAARLARGPDLTAARDISSVSRRSPTTSPPHVDYGSWSLAEASLSVLQSSTVAPMHVDAPETCPHLARTP